MNSFYQNSYGNVFGTMVSTPLGRIALAHLSSPSVKFQPPKYQAHLLFSKNDEKVKASLKLLLAQCDDLLNQQYGDKEVELKYPPLRDGDEVEYQGFAGCWYLKASSKNQPECVDFSKKEIDPALILNGMLCQFIVTPMTFDNGIAYQLSSVRLVKDDGIRFYGGPDPKSLYTPLDEALNGESVEVTKAGEPPKKKSAKGMRAALDLV